MTVGFPAGKDQINARAGQVAMAVRESLREAGILKAWFDGKTDAELVALGFSTEDVGVLKSAFTDLDNLRKVATGQSAQAQANNFLFWAGRLTGLQ